jgi:hypothetical protein
MDTPRIFEVDPTVASNLDRLRDEMLAAALELALARVHHVYPRPFAPDAEAETYCDRCGGSFAPEMTPPGVPLLHKPTCPAGKILAYVDAVNEARMGVERRREVRSLVAPRELHIRKRCGTVLTHAQAAAVHAAETAFPLVQVIVDSREVAAR